MFLKSITVAGFLDIEVPRTAQFKFEEEVNKSSVDTTFLEAFSIIFDPNYDASCDLTKFINHKFTGSSFVKVVLWQSDEDTLTGFSWLKNTHLTVERILKIPHQVVVNGKVMGTDEFHQAVSSFGYISNDGFHLHRLLDREINRICFFSGEDLWNLITVLFSSKQLVEVVNSSEKKRKILNQQIHKNIERLESELPNKLKMRDNIQMHFKLMKRFRTLMAVNNERKLVHLEKQRDVVSRDQVQLMNLVSEKSQEVCNAQTENAQTKLERKTREKLLEFVIREHNSSLSNFLDGSTATENFFDKLKATHETAVQSLESIEAAVNLSGEYQANLSQTEGQLTAIDWKISLKTVKDIDEDEYHKRLKMLHRLLEIERIKASQSLEQLKATELKVHESLNKAKDLDMRRIDVIEKEIISHRRNQLRDVEKLSDLEVEIIAKTEEALDIKLVIDIVTNKSEVESSYVETLLEIELLMMANHDLSVNYLGPLFKFLTFPAGFETNLWLHLSSIVGIFLFTRGSTARKVNRLLLESRKILGRYVFLGIDEFVKRAETKLFEEQQNLVRSAEALVPQGIELENLLKTLVRETVLEAAIESDGHGTKESFHLPSGRVHFSSSEIQLQSYVLSLQNIYANIKEHANLIMQVEENRKVKLEVEKHLKETVTDIEQLQDEANRSKLLIESYKEAIEDLRVMLIQKKRHLQLSTRNRLLSEMQKDLETLDSWNIEELEQSRQMKAEELEERESKCYIQERTVRDETSRSITIIEISLKMLDECLEQSEAKTELKNALERYRQKTKMGVKAARQNYLKPSIASSTSTKLQIDLFELRCRLYEKNSERDVVDHAIQLCNVSDNLDETLYEASKDENIADALGECQQQLQTEKSRNLLNLMSKDHYMNLVQSITSISRYSEAPDPTISRNELLTKSFPLLNKFVVKVLKDAVHNYQISFANVMEDFACSSTLFFYTHGVFDGVNDDQFSWDSFDLGRLRALDFVVKWKRESRDNVSSSSLSKIKALILIVHIINYLSIFKFIIIDEKFFDNIDESLVKKLEALLEAVSPFVQIILHKQEARVIEPMET